MKPLICIAIIFVMPALAQQTSTDNTTLQALLAEVRQLRMALERTASLGPRIQMALQRVQLQQDQVVRLSRQLDDMRSRMAQRASEHGHMLDELKSGEGRLLQEQNPQTRRDLEERLKAFKAELDRQSSQEQQQRAIESELAGRLQTEQAKLSELQDRLNTLERLLDAPAKQP